METHSLPRPLVLGLLGGIASGKSAAARLLAGPEGWVLSADRIVHELLAGGELAGRVAEAFGEDLLLPAGGVDRARLGELVFDPESGTAARERLEGWTHPLVRARILERLAEARAKDVPRVVLDVPLLLETDDRHGLLRLCHALVFVDAPDDLRDRRAQDTRGWPPGEVARREAAQLSLKEKRERAEYVLSNDRTLEDLELACRALLERIERDPALLTQDPHDGQKA